MWYKSILVQGDGPTVWKDEGGRDKTFKNGYQEFHHRYRREVCDDASRVSGTKEDIKTEVDTMNNHCVERGDVPHSRSLVYNTK